MSIWSVSRLYPKTDFIVPTALLGLGKVSLKAARKVDFPAQPKPRRCTLMLLTALTCWRLLANTRKSAYRCWCCGGDKDGSLDKQASIISVRSEGFILSNNLHIKGTGSSLYTNSSLSALACKITSTGNWTRLFLTLQTDGSAFRITLMISMSWFLWKARCKMVFIWLSCRHHIPGPRSNIPTGGFNAAPLSRSRRTMAASFRSQARYSSVSPTFKMYIS